eukprot:COSAG02_NODE_163_length_32424_cov_21.759010_24_plen_113_part_00
MDSPGRILDPPSRPSVCRLLSWTKFLLESVSGSGRRHRRQGVAHCSFDRWSQLPSGEGHLVAFGTFSNSATIRDGTELEAFRVCLADRFLLADHRFAIGSVRDAVRLHGDRR